jgi:large subunit ribosomal protein L31
MKANIHPQWYSEALVTCACGNTFKIGDTKPELRVEICSRCHPFFTGEMRFQDSEGKVDRFIKRREAAAAKAPQLAQKKAKKASLQQTDNSPKSLKEMLMGI